jgi:hypothetical protein
MEAPTVSNVSLNETKTETKEKQEIGREWKNSTILKNLSRQTIGMVIEISKPCQGLFYILLKYTWFQVVRVTPSST